jgi:hypothetical protein
MASTRTSAGEGSEPRGELGRLKVDSSATMEELREFLGQMHGRSTQEVLGLVAQSGLASGIVTATVGCAVLLVVFTVGPYLFYGGEEAKAKEAAAAAATAETESETDSTATAEGEGEGEALTDQEKAAKAMGIGETKVLDPNKAPMNDPLDNLLEGVD